MISSARARYIRSLHQKKYREQQGRFIAEGTKLVTELLRSSFKIDAVYATPGWIEENPGLPVTSGLNITGISHKEMERISALSTPGPVLAVAEIPRLSISAIPVSSGLILALDEIRDPGNLGTILRIADWFGIGTVVCSENTVELYNPKVVQATMGSIARVKVHYVNLPEWLSLLPAATRIYGTFPEGDSVYSKELDDHGIIIIGNESLGISSGVARYITDRISIPSFPQAESTPSSAESLNASVATAIVCSEFRRRRTIRVSS